MPRFAGLFGRLKRGTKLKKFYAEQFCIVVEHKDCSAIEFVRAWVFPKKEGSPLFGKLMNHLISEKPVEGRKLIELAYLVVILVAFAWAKEFLLRLILAILISFLLAPAVSRLERWRFPGVIAILSVVGISEAYIGMARAFQNAWFAFYRTFVIPKTNDKYSRRVLEKVMDCVDMVRRLYANWKFRYDRRKGTRKD